MKILHVDDERHICMLVKLSLDEKGYESSYETNPMIGLKKALEGKFDLIILDLMMPLMDGFQFMKEFRKRDKDTPIMVLTAKSQLVDKFKSINCGADDYIVKPFEPKELLRRIRCYDKGVLGKK